ncbi:glycoside hydrolase family 2 TIM barrel-domain containing protein [Aquimarina algiphila]|uniref:glycoside hydrolase family 2 TIM barrel-domain containing protein n=1 Tax=Aquimarina algiphila TaxID=2047982 RepID=UPI00232BB89A|nr:glycoside hydrolase family 2 TIM barrel-domain containing protein [Aquimarina algiphila]
MNFYVKMLSYCSVIWLFIGCQDTQFTIAKTIKINDNWKFVQEDIPKAKEIDFDDSRWETVDLPHDWSISKPFSQENPSFSRGAWLPAGISYYRKNIDLSEIGENQKVFIHFEGAYRNAEVWINNHYLGKRPSGYAAFEYELTPFISSENENIITVKLDNSEQPGSRWYSGNGIYRDVYLITKNDIYIPTWGTYVTTPKVNSNSAIINVETSLKNTKVTDEKVTLKISIIDDEGVEVIKKQKEVILKQESEQKEKIELILNTPKLWGVNSPNLYTVKVELFEGNLSIDTKTVKAGIRSMVYTVEDGFVLNDKPLKVKGVCLHHGAGPLGAAARKTSYERQIRILKEMGANAVRTAHNPFDTEFLETCDEMGMLVMNEAFDEWEIAKEPQTFREKGNKIRIPVSYYAHLFKEYSDKDLTDFVIRDRNHPSIFMWSIGNEIDQMHDESGVAIAKRLSNIIHKYDYRPATCGVNGYGWDKWPHEPAVAQIDVPGYNYAKGKNYDKEHDDFPNRKMIVTEHTSAQMIANRGEYYPFKNKDQTLQLDLPIEHPDTEKFLKSRNFYAGGMQAWQDVKNRSFVMGAFIWTGWDYLGETIPYAWPARSSSFGVIDLAGFPKDGYYYYQSEWSDKPMIHTFPHWNWKGHEGEKINLNVFSNTKEVELFVNGVSQGKKINNSNNADMLSWEVLYQPGTVKAIGYTDGRKIIEEEIKTAGTTNSLQLEVTDSSEVTYIEVTALDVNGIFVATAENLINFEVENAKIIGVGNGNNRSLEPFVANYRKLYNGKCVVILQKQDNHSKAFLKATLSETKITQSITF